LVGGSSVSLLGGDGVEHDESVEQWLGAVAVAAVRFERDGEE